MKNSESEFSKPPRESAVSRVVINSPENEKFVLEYFQSVFENQPVADLEREKTPEELELIGQLNDRLKHFVESYGGSWIEVKPENIHIVDKQKVEKLEDKGKKENIEKMMDDMAGGFALNTQSVIIYKDSPKLKFVNALVHEMLHFNSFNSYSRSAGNGVKVDVRRMGFGIFLKNESKLRFNDVNEAVIVELQKRFAWLNFSDLDFIKEDYEVLEDLRARLSLKGRADLAEDIGYLDESSVRPYSYLYERKALWAMIDTIYSKNKEKFENKEEIFRVFAEATMSGKLLPAARLIEKTYGKGSFRNLGELTKMSDSD